MSDSIYLDILYLGKQAIEYLQTHTDARYALIAVTLLFVCILLLRLITDKNPSSTDAFTAKDFDRIAGEDIPSTQLDLAKAYIEMNQKKQAKMILKQVIKQAQGQLRLDAKQLMKTL